VKQALAIVVHELKLFLSDRRSVVVGIVTPILLATFFGFLFSGAGRQDAAKIPVLVADADDSAVSRAVVAGLAADALLSVSPAAAEDARQAVRRGKAAAGVVLPKGFGEGAVQAFFGAAAAPEIVLLVDPSRATEAGLVRGLLAEKVFREASREAFGGATGTKVLEESLVALEADPSPPTAERQALKDLLRDVTRWQGAAKGGTAGGGAAGGLGTAVPFTLKEEPVTARQGVTYNSYAHSFAGMAIQFLLFVAIDFGIALLLERQGGLWKRLRSAPLSRSALLLGDGRRGARRPRLRRGDVRVRHRRPRDPDRGERSGLRPPPPRVGADGLLVRPPPRGTGKDSGGHARPRDPRRPPPRDARRGLGPRVRLSGVAAEGDARPADALGDRRPRRGDVARRRPRGRRPSGRRGPPRLHGPVPPRRAPALPLDRPVARQSRRLPDRVAQGRPPHLCQA